MSFDPIANFTRVKVDTTHNHDEAVTTIYLQTSEGDKLPNPAIEGQYNLVWWNTTLHADATSDDWHEIVRVVSKSGDRLEVVRAQEGTTATAKNIPDCKYRLALQVTAKTITDLQHDSSGTVSPLTTKGDLYTFASDNDRLPVGMDGQALFADSAQDSGIIWRGIKQTDIIPDYSITGFAITNGVLFDASIGATTVPYFSWSTNQPTVFGIVTGDVSSQILTGLPSSYGTLVWDSSVSSDTGFTLTASDGTVTHNAGASVRFVYPFYHGVGAAGLDGTAISALTKHLATESNYTHSFTTTANVAYYAYPASYGALSSIIDSNGFNVTPDWTLRTVTISGQSYNVYEFNNPTTTTQSYVFNF